ncbi:Hypothetical protein GbCGDNIH5_8157 [Granulibacter bethesdensis]|nr:Hypothetical protein GbCGDNIH5_8157 [Granulibacter bethesdensis]
MRKAGHAILYHRFAGLTGPSALLVSKLARIAARRTASSTSTKRHGSLNPTEGARHASASKRGRVSTGKGSRRKWRTSRRQRKRRCNSCLKAESKETGSVIYMPTSLKRGFTPCSFLFLRRIPVQIAEEGFVQHSVAAMPHP